MSKYSVKLNQEQRQMVEELVKKGTAPARKIQLAYPGVAMLTRIV